MQDEIRKRNAAIRREIKEIEDRLNAEEGISQKRLYKPQTLGLDGRYVETIEELIREVDMDWILHIVVLDYIGDFKGKRDVIRKAYISGSVYQTKSPSGHYSYQSKSKKQEPMWIELGGDLETEYRALRDNGVELTEEVRKIKIKR